MRIRIQLKQFENEFSQLEKKLQILLKNYSITESEHERRIRELERLCSEKVQIDLKFQNSPATSSRSQLLSDATTRQALFDDDDDKILTNTAPMETLRSEQIKIIDQQDKGLDSLSKVITRQKFLAQRIGTEIDDHNDIIDNLAIQVDNVDSRVGQETRHVEAVNKKDSTWSYWIIIISLFVAIIIVGII